MTIAMPDPARHPMADPLTRRRAGAVFAALFALGWVVVSLLGRPAGFYSEEELRHVSGIPYAPPQIQRRIAPPVSDPAELDRQIEQLQDLLRGSPPAQPSPAATR